MAVLQVAAAEPSIEDDLLRTGALLVGVVLAATAIAAWAGWRLVANALNPVDDMSTIARDIGATADFSRRLPVPESPKDPDEIGRLAQTFNQMLADLEEAFSVQRRFLADAAHELRTPLTVIRASAETWRRGDRAAEHGKGSGCPDHCPGSGPNGPPVADLLTLARGDAGQPDARRPVQFDSIVVDVYRQARTLTDDVTLTLAEFDQVMVSGDPDRLRQLVLNLVDNAIRYTPPGGSVTLELAQSPGWAILRVRDTGQASRRTSCRASSTGSTGWTPPAPGVPAGPDSAWPSARRLPRRTGDGSRSAAKPARARCLPCTCPQSRRSRSNREHTLSPGRARGRQRLLRRRRSEGRTPQDSRLG